MIAQNGHVILSQGYGFANRENKTPNTSQTKFRIATLSQPFTAMAILLLQEQHKLTVQDSICSYLPDCPDTWKPITLHHLLTHSAGLPDTTDFSLLPEQVITEAQTKPLLFQPGDRWSNSAIGYDLLGKIIEIVSGQSYEAFLQHNIFEPLKMLSTGYDHEQADLAIGYSGAGTDSAKSIDPQGLFAAGALYSTVEDLYFWDQALYTNDLVSQNTLDSMFTGHIQNPHYPVGMKAGYGGYVVVLPTSPRLIEGTGYINDFGYVSVVHRWLDDKIVIIILANQQNSNVWDYAALVNKELFGR